MEKPPPPVSITIHNSAGSNCGAKYKLMTPAMLPISRSACIIIPPGLSPSSFLESPVLLSKSNHAILRYLASAFPVAADHWYPRDLHKRASVECILDWHHSNLHPGSAGYVFNTILAPAFGLPLNPQAASENRNLLSASLATIDTYCLRKDGSFLLGNSKPSLADLSLVCEIMQLEFLDEKDRESILSPHTNVLKWIDDVKSAAAPHFDEIHAALFKVREILQQKRSGGASS